jgi:hypothetical protein
MRLGAGDEIAGRETGMAKAEEVHRPRISAAGSSRKISPDNLYMSNNVRLSEKHL